MKKLVFLFILALVCTGTALSGEVTGETSDLEQATCTSRTADELVAEWRESLLTEVREKPYPSCPEVRDTCRTGSTQCEGQNSCGVSSGPATLADTGLDVCQQADGTLFQCKGKTIHVKSLACEQCPCCYGPPPNCLCPWECGEVSTLTCN
jgi:hypothetical protein